MDGDGDVDGNGDGAETGDGGDWDGTESFFFYQGIKSM